MHIGFGTIYSFRQPLKSKNGFPADNGGQLCLDLSGGYTGPVYIFKLHQILYSGFTHFTIHMLHVNNIFVEVT